MRKFILVFVIGIFCLGLFAQKGMFDIAFDQDMKEVHKILTDNGFVETWRNEKEVTYNNPKIPDLKQLKVKDTDIKGKVSSWSIQYDIDSESEIPDKIREELDELYGTSFYDSYFDEWVWEIDMDYAIYYYFNEEKNVLTILYDINDLDYYYDLW